MNDDQRQPDEDLLDYAEEIKRIKKDRKALVLKLNEFSDERRLAEIQFDEARLALTRAKGKERMVRDALRHLQADTIDTQVLLKTYPREHR